ncbi:MAG: hypothetical protein RR329_03295 [Mucinivorans sp.]
MKNFFCFWACICMFSVESHSQTLYGEPGGGHEPTVLKVDSVLVSRADTRRERRAARERVRVKALVRQMVESKKFQFEMESYEYKGTHRIVDPFKWMFRCYGDNATGYFAFFGDMVPSNGRNIKKIVGHSEELGARHTTDSIASYGANYFSARACEVVNIEEPEMYILTFDVVAKLPRYDAILGWCYDHIFHFALNYLTGRMQMQVVSCGRNGASYVGYLNTLR